MSEFESSRRNLLKAVGLAWLAYPYFSLFSNPKRKAQIALQLYTVRHSLGPDFEGTIRKIADTGFVGVESFPLPESITVKHAAKALKDAGLKVLGMHTALPVGKQRDQVLRMAEAYDSRRVIYPGGPPEHRSTIEDTVKYMVEVYNETAGFFKTKGLEFGLHNHWWEFENTDGVYPFYYLLENLDASVFFELDTYWIKTAGFDPARAVKDFGRRAPLLHIKDGPAVKGSTADRQVPVGAGSMDFPAIVAAGGENIEWMIVEFDEYEKDIFDGIRQSYSFLTKRGLAAGKI